MRRMLALLLALIICLAGAAVSEGTSVFDDVTAPEGLDVYFMPVGRNDGILIICDGEAAFIDSGTYTCGSKCVGYMKDAGVKELKYYIGSHAHADHVGGASPILAAFPTQEILTNHELAIQTMLENSGNTEETQAVKNTPWRAVSKGDSFTIGGAVLTCIGPDSIRQYSKASFPEENENSLILRLEYGDISFVFTGDTTNEIMAQMLKSDPEILNCTVFKSPHHYVGLNDEVAAQVKFDYYVFSTSEKYPPATHSINNARRTGARVFITNSNNSGGVVFSTDGETITHKTQNSLSEKWKLDKTTLTLKVGNSKSITASLRPSNMIDTLYYTTSDASVAYPDPATGRITAVGVGECTVSAIGFDDSVRSIKVTVKKK